MSKEAMTLAREALIAATPAKAKDPYMQAAALVALEEALAKLAEQPAPVQQEPVAWWDAKLGVFDEKHFDQLQPLYTTPQAQPALVPVYCEYCGGNDEDPQDHCMDCTRPRWEPVTTELLANQHPWLYEPMWIASGGMVEQGYYEWRQGHNPDRFITDGGEDWAFNFDYVMPILKPAPPAIEAAHGIKENQS